MNFRLTVLCLVFSLSSSYLAPAGDAKPAEKLLEQPQSFTGKVLPLATILAKHGVKIDPDAAAAIALVTDNGTTYTLGKDDDSRLLFLDKQLHNRPVKLMARLIPGTQILKVVKVQTVVNGKLYDVDYWCEACQFSNPEPGPCRCCGGETEFRELAVK